MNPGYSMSDAELRTWNKDLVNQTREAEVYDPFQFSGHTFDGDTKAVGNIISAFAMALLLTIQNSDFPPEFKWRTYDNIDLPANKEFVVGLAVAYSTRRSACYQQSWVLKAQIDLLSGQDLLDFDITVGWPA